MGEGEMAQKKLGGGRNRGKSREEGEKEKLGVGGLKWMDLDEEIILLNI